MATYPPAKTGSTTPFYPGIIVSGYDGQPGGGTVLSLTAAYGHSGLYKAATVVMIEFTIYCTNSVASTQKIYPYGSTTAGNGNNLGTSLTVNVPATGGPVFYTSAQNISISAGGYIGIAAACTSGTTAIVAIDAVMWFTQAAI